MPTGPPASAMSPEVMPMLHFPGLMMPGQFGPRRRVSGEFLDQAVVRHRLVLGRDALGDADDERDACFGRLDDGVGRAAGRHADKRRRRSGLLHRLGHRGVDGDALDFLAASLGIGAGHDLCAVRLVTEPVEQPLARRADALDHDLGRLVDEDAHVGSSRCFRCGLGLGLRRARRRGGRHRAWWARRSECRTGGRPAARDLPQHWFRRGA